MHLPQICVRFPANGPAEVAKGGPWARGLAGVSQAEEVEMHHAEITVAQAVEAGAALAAR
jgi:hypothetical protein